MCRFLRLPTLVLWITSLSIISQTGCGRTQDAPETVDEKPLPAEEAKDIGEREPATGNLSPTSVETGPPEKTSDPVGTAPAEPESEHPVSPGRKNRLAKETSPYLLQHATNPVDWYPWGAEALARARQENKPIFLSIGYSSCHWCHVMERESFVDPEIAKYMNEHFVCIKVDREERPDIDTIYMTAVQIISRRGGWPLSAFLTPEGKPFFGGTYFPARDNDRPGAIGFQTVMRRIVDAWTHNRDDLKTDGERIAEAIALELAGSDADATPPLKLSKKLIDNAQVELVKRFDEEHGGFGYDFRNPNEPKFPQSPTLLYLADRAAENDEARRMLLTTLDRIAMGGIRDHIGGGFARYSVDRFWHIPHFEKMLYDNGQLATVYAEAYALTHEPEYRRILDQMVMFLDRDMTNNEGAFYAALDADSEHVEGKFYRWELDEWDELLGGDAEFCRRVYAAQNQPNFEHEFYVPLFQQRWDELAAAEELKPTQLTEKLDSINARLLAARSKRVRPGLDDKILSSWNGMMIRGLADAGRILEKPEYTQRAAKAAEFVLDKLVVDGRLRRTFSRGEARLNAYAVDYACVIEGLLALHRATADPQWLTRAEELLQQQDEFYWDEEHGGYFFTPSDHEALIARGKRFVDSARPSGNSVSAQNLLYFATTRGDPKYRQRAEQIIQAARDVLRRSPSSSPRMAMAVAELLKQSE